MSFPHDHLALKLDPTVLRAEIVRVSELVDSRLALPMYRADRATDREIAVALDVSKGTVWNWRRSKSLPPNGTVGKTYKRWHITAFRLHSEGKSRKAIATLLGKTLAAVYKVFQRKAGRRGKGGLHGLPSYCL